MRSLKKREITVHGDDRPWNTGNPPAQGWYEASVQRKPRLYRWWNGKNWSVFSLRTMGRFQAAVRATYAFSPSPGDVMYWRDI